MKPFSDLAQSGSALRMLTSHTGWSGARIGEAARAAEQRLRQDAPSEPVRARGFEQQVPQALPSPPPRPLPAVRLRLASGRSVRVRMPEVAARADLRAVARTAELNAQRQTATLTQHARALDALHKRGQELEARVRAAQAQADLALLAALGGSSRVAEQLAATERRVDAQERTARTLVRRQRFQVQTDRAQRVQSAVSAMQVAAYGERGNVLAPNNLLLAGSALLWGSIDSLLRRLGWWSQPEPVPLTWLGPLLGLVVGHYTIGQQQFERTITGPLALAKIPGDGGEMEGLQDIAFEGSLDLRPHIAPAFWDEFRSKPSLPARAQITQVGVLGLVVAWVERGTLRVLALLAEPSDEDSLQVTWTVDLEAARA